MGDTRTGDNLIEINVTDDRMMTIIMCLGMAATMPTDMVSSGFIILVLLTGAGLGMYLKLVDAIKS